MSAPINREYLLAPYPKDDLPGFRKRCEILRDNIRLLEEMVALVMTIPTMFKRKK